jgi:hypothetical protein
MMKQADMPSGLEGGESWDKAMNPDPAHPEKIGRTRSGNKA